MMEASTSTVHTDHLHAAPVAWSPPKRRVGGSLKGKERALEERSYPGVITYRHLLAPGSGGPTNPLRVVSHVDIDAAYAAMEMARLGLDPATPLAVQQWQGLIAVNYPARTFGITRHETPASALLKCPHLVMVHCASYRAGDTEPGYWENPSRDTHKISLDHYRRESLKIIKVFQQHCPTVEKASIDESFLDLTLPVRTLLLSRYPILATLPASAGGDLDTPLPSPLELGITVVWDDVGNCIPIGGTPDAVVESVGEEGTSESEEREGRELEAELGLTWSDVALAIGAEIVATCRGQVQSELGYTCSAGIAPNKMLAKLCSAWKKPNAQTILRFSAVAAFLEPMKFQKIRNLGGKLGGVIQAEYAAETVGDLLSVTLKEFQEKLGDASGTWVWEIIRGLDLSEVEAKTQVKSILASKNFRPTVTKFSEINHWLGILATELHLRLTEARTRSPGLWAKTITFSHRSATFVVKSHQIPFPYTSNLTIPYVSRCAEKLVRIAIGEIKGGLKDESRVGPYSNIQLSFSGLGMVEEGQKGIEGFFSAAVVGKDSGKRTSEQVEGEAEEEDDGKRMRLEGPVLEEDVPIIAPPDPPIPTFTCPRCYKVLILPPSAIDSLRPTFDPITMEQLLAKERSEHDDYHFARDMLESERKGARSAPVVGKKVVVPSKSKVKPGGQQTLSGFFKQG